MYNYCSFGNNPYKKFNKSKLKLIRNEFQEI